MFIFLSYFIKKERIPPPPTNSQRGPTPFLENSFNIEYLMKYQNHVSVPSVCESLSDCKSSLKCNDRTLAAQVWLMCEHKIRQLWGTDTSRQVASRARPELGSSPARPRWPHKPTFIRRGINRRGGRDSDQLNSRQKHRSSFETLLYVLRLSLSLTITSFRYKNNKNFDE